MFVSSFIWCKLKLAPNNFGIIQILKHQPTVMRASSAYLSLLLILHTPSVHVIVVGNCISLNSCDPVRTHYQQWRHAIVKQGRARGERHGKGEETDLFFN